MSASTDTQFSTDLCLAHYHLAIQPYELVIHKPDEERSIVTVALLDDLLHPISPLNSLLPHQHAFVVAHYQCVATVHLLFFLCVQMLERTCSISLLRFYNDPNPEFLIVGESILLSVLSHH